jgi:HlyD family secretion protein
VEFENRERKLFPGMTAYVTIPVATAADAIKVPNAALRYKPPMSVEAVRALYAKRGIDTGAQRDAASASGAPRAGTPAAAEARGPRRGESAVVWRRLADDSLEPVQISLGITDHTFTEVAGLLAGKLEPGDEVVTSSVPSKALPPGAQGIRR